MPAGRPSKYSKELGSEICREVAANTDGLRKLCADNPHWPPEKTINHWRLDFPEFRLQYETAKREQAELLAQEIQEIADFSACDILIKYDRDGNPYEVENKEYIARSRLRVDARKWIACKLLPKVYGEKQEHTHDVTVRHEEVLKELAE